MQALLELLALIVSEGPESFTPSYSDDFALFIQPHGKSYQDLVNLLPKLSRELMTKVVVAARHWARYENVEVLGGRRRRYSIEDCSRDDLSLSGFGNITPQELPSSPDPNRACMQNLASALFGNNISSSIAQLSSHTIISHGAARNKYMKDHRIQRSTEETLQSIGSTEVEIDDKDAMEALENLMLLHESVDQLESWKRFSDAHAALPLPPWRTTAAKVGKSTLEEKKAMLLRKSSRGHSVSKTGRAKVRGQAQPHDVSALIPLVPTRNSSLCTLDKGLCTFAEDGLSPNEPYNYKTSYWQFKHRQDCARHDLPPGLSPLRRVNHMVTATVRHLATTLLLDNESETMSVGEETCLSGSLNPDSLIESSDSSAQSCQRNSPATTPQHELAEFVAPPMKDLYSAPIVIDLSQPPPGARPPALSDGITSAVAVSTPKKYVTAAIDTFAIKAATKKRPPPFIFPSPPSPTVLSKSMTTSSLSPTTAESYITKVSTQASTEQEGKECLVTVKKGWRICEKPLMHWKRKSASTVLAAAPSHPHTSALSISSSADWGDLAAATPRTSSPITINAAVSSTHTATRAASTFPAPTNPSKLLGLGFSIQTQNDASRSKTSRPNLNILIKEINSAASLPSSVSFTSQDGSLTSTSSPGLGCSIASIPFPENYMPMVLSPSSSISALWAAPTPIPTLTVPNGSSPRMDSFRMVTSISPLPSPSTTSAGSRKKRLQEKLFGKKSKLPLDDTCSSLYPCPLSPSIQSKRMNVHNGGVAGILGVGGGVGAGGGGVGGGNGPVLKSSSSFGSLREKKSFGQLIVPLVLAPLEQRGILKTRSRSSSSASVTAVGAACLIHGQDPRTPISSYPRHCYDPLNDHGHHHHHQRPPFHRANSQPVAVPVLPSFSPPSPTPGHTAAERRYHNKLPIGSVASGVGGVTSSRDDKEANAQIWKVIHEWSAWMDAHSASFK
ncbi:hypothetical protein KI688_003163 [Linnemannia hyalina]|uniref:Uncharacterized protein n=1 Tax=Linnemannia hyalina TaxID=64524 RepID=A0A9P8BRD5_9FUNG|nr:hypothetical protein KI688_003163 [Linnemannia hyalina]